MALGVFSREVEVVAHLRLEVAIALDNPYSRHVEVVVFLLERRRTESHDVASTYRKIA